MLSLHIILLIKEAMIVLKFGGTSVGSIERLQKLPKLIKRDKKTIVVLSAMSGVTNSLELIIKHLQEKKHSEAKLILENDIHVKFISTAAALFSSDKNTLATKNIERRIGLIESFFDLEMTENTSKIILAQGELITTELFSFYLDTLGVKNQLLMATDYMYLDENGEPNNEKIFTELDKRTSSEYDIYITQGFVATNINGDIDNLKRGGSDYSASIIGAVLNAEAIEIWTDITGFHNNDPRFVENTQTVKYLSFDEAAELAYFGAKILHPSSIIPARKNNIPVWLKNTMCPEKFGTLISDKHISKGIKAIAAKGNITIIKIQSYRMLQAHGFLSKIFNVFDEFKTPIDVITTSEVAVSLTVDNTDELEDIIKELEFFGRVEIKSDCAIISIVGNGITNSTKAMSNVYQSLKTFSIQMISFGGSHNNITFVVDENIKNNVLQLLNKQIFLRKNV